MVATSAENGEEKIGKLLHKAMEKVGMDIGSIVLCEKEKSENSNNELEFVNGMMLDLPPVSHFFMTDMNRTCRHILIVAGDVSMEVLGSLAMDRVNISVNVAAEVCAVKPPILCENKKAIMQVLAILTGSQVVTRSIEVTKIQQMLGSCKEARVSYGRTLFVGETVIIGGSGDLADIEERCEQLRSEIKASTSDYEAKLLEFRLKKLSLGVAVFKVGGANLCSKNKRIDYTFDAVKAALEEGILPARSESNLTH